jgi:hypothetical protein
VGGRVRCSDSNTLKSCPRVEDATHRTRFNRKDCNHASYQFYFSQCDLAERRTGEAVKPDRVTSVLGIGDRLQALAKRRGSDLIRLSMSWTSAAGGSFRVVIVDGKYGEDEIAAARTRTDIEEAINIALEFAESFR